MLEVSDDRKYTVLLIESSAERVEAVRRMLAEQYECEFTLRHLCGLGEAPLASDPTDPDAVLLSAGATAGDTLAALALVFAQTDDLPVVVLCDDEGIGIRAVRQGAEDYLLHSHLDGVLLARTLAHGIERRRSSRRLAEREAQLRLALEAGGMGSWEWRIDTNRVSWSESQVRIHGTDAQGFDGSFEGFERTLHPDDRARVVEELRHVLRTGAGRFRSEYRILRPEGEVRWLESRGVVQHDGEGRPARMAGITIDITARKEGEEELRFSKELLETLLNNIPDLAWIQDRDSRFLAVNAAAVHAFGVAREALLGRTGIEVLPPEVREAVARDHERILATGERLTVEEVVPEPDGTVRWFESVKAPFRDSDGRVAGTVGISRDITQRRASAEALRRNEAQFRELAENVDAVFWLYDRHAERTLYVNAAYEQIWGRAVNELFSSPDAWMESIHPDDRARVVGARPAHNLGGHVLEYRIVRPDGEVRWIRDRSFAIRNEGGELYRVAGLSQDVTAEKRAELLQSGQRRVLEMIVNGAPLAEVLTAVALTIEEQFSRTLCSILLVDEDGAHLRFGAAPSFPPEYAQLVDGLPVADGPGTCPSAVARQAPVFASGADAYPNVPALRAMVRDIEMVACWSLPIAASSGDIAAVVALHFPHANGPSPRDEALLESVSRVVGLAIERARTERALRQREEELRQALKMEAIGRLAGGIAHDFNNLLNVIGGCAALMSEELPPVGSVRDDLEEIQRAVRRAAGMTRQLLAFSRKQLLSPRELPVNEWLERSANMLQRLIGEDIEVELLLDPRVGSIRADSSQLDQVLINLAVNGRDAMPEGGRLQISTQAVEVGASGRLRSLRDLAAGRYVLLTVADEGHGMDAETAARAFEPFFTTKETGKGTGLGLSTVYGIVKQSGGQIAVETAPGRGTRILIALPSTAAAAAATQHPVPSITAPLQGRETVLVVEDEAAVRRVLCKILERHGYTVLEADCGEAALDCLADSGRSVHLVLTDVVMPRMSGLELAERVQREWPGLGVLCLSGYAEEALAARDRSSPRPPMLHKPVRPEELLQAVRDLLDARPTG